MKRRESALPRCTASQVEGCSKVCPVPGGLGQLRGQHDHSCLRRASWEATFGWALLDE